MDESKYNKCCVIGWGHDIHFDDGEDVKGRATGWTAVTLHVLVPNTIPHPRGPKCMLMYRDVHCDVVEIGGQGAEIGSPRGDLLFDPWYMEGLAGLTFEEAERLLSPLDAISGTNPYD